MKASGNSLPMEIYFIRRNHPGVVRAWQVPGFQSVDFKLLHGSVFGFRRDMQVSPNGRYLATFGDDSVVAIWDVATRKPLKRVATDMQYCQLVFSPDGSKLVLSGKPRIRIVDLQSMEVADFLDDSGTSLKGCIEFSSDGQRLFRGDGKRLAVHRIADGAQIATSDEHREEILSLSCAPDGATVATGSSDRTVLLHDTQANKVVAALREHDLAVSRVAFLPDGRLVSGGTDGRICVWNIHDAKKPPRWPVSVPGAYNYNMWQYWPAISCSPNGSTIASTNLQVREGSPPGTKPKPGITLRSAIDLHETATLAESSGAVSAVLYSPVEDLLVITNEAGALEFISSDESGSVGSASGANDSTDNAELDSVENSIVYSGGILVPVRFSSDGKRLLVVAKKPREHKHEDQKTIFMAVYHVQNRHQIAKWTLPPEYCATISPDGRMVATGHDDGVRFWSIENQVTSTHAPVGGFRAGNAGLIWSVDFSPDGKHLIAGSNVKGHIEILDVQTKQGIDKLHGHITTVGAVRFSPDGLRVASGMRAVKIWDFETRREIMAMTIEGSWGGTRHLEWLPDGNAIAVGAGDSILSIFRVPSKREIQKTDSD